MWKYILLIFSIDQIKNISIKESLGPIWYQELSDKQVSMVENLKGKRGNLVENYVDDKKWLCITWFIV